MNYKELYRKQPSHLDCDNYLWNFILFMPGCIQDCILGDTTSYQPFELDTNCLHIFPYRSGIANHFPLLSLAPEDYGLTRNGGGYNTLLCGKPSSVLLENEEQLERVSE